VPELIELENWPPDSPDLNPVLMLNFVWTNTGVDDLAVTFAVCLS